MWDTGVKCTGHWPNELQTMYIMLSQKCEGTLPSLTQATSCFHEYHLKVELPPILATTCANSSTHTSIHVYGHNSTYWWTHTHKHTHTCVNIHKPLISWKPPEGTSKNTCTIHTYTCKQIATTAAHNNTHTHTHKYKHTMYICKHTCWRLDSVLTTI